MNGWSVAIQKKRELAEVCQQRGVDMDMLTGRRRTRPISLARHEAMYRLRRLGLSYPRIGQILGGRDHSTVIHGIRQHCLRNGLEAPR